MDVVLPEVDSPLYFLFELLKIPEEFVFLRGLVPDLELAILNVPFM